MGKRRRREREREGGTREDADDEYRIIDHLPDYQAKNHENYR